MDHPAPGRRQSLCPKEAEHRSQPDGDNCKEKGFPQAPLVGKQADERRRNGIAERMNHTDVGRKV